MGLSRTCCLGGSKGRSCRDAHIMASNEGHGPGPARNGPRRQSSLCHWSRVSGELWRAWVVVDWRYWRSGDLPVGIQKLCLFYLFKIVNFIIFEILTHQPFSYHSLLFQFKCHECYLSLGFHGTIQGIPCKLRVLVQVPYAQKRTLEADAPFNLLTRSTCWLCVSILCCWPTVETMLGNESVDLHGVPDIKLLTIIIR